MDVAHIRLVHRDPYGCKVKGFRVVSSIERNVLMRHLHGVQQWSTSSMKKEEKYYFYFYFYIYFR